MTMLKTYDADRSNYIPREVRDFIEAGAQLRAEGLEHFATNSRTGYVVRMPGTGWCDFSATEVLQLLAGGVERVPEPAGDAP